jgi:hypothetical protein
MVVGIMEKWRWLRGMELMIEPFRPFNLVKIYLLQMDFWLRCSTT